MTASAPQCSAMWCVLFLFTLTPGESKQCQRGTPCLITTAPPLETDPISYYHHSNTIPQHGAISRALPMHKASPYDEQDVMHVLSRRDTHPPNPDEDNTTRHTRSPCPPRKTYRYVCSAMRQIQPLNKTALAQPFNTTAQPEENSTTTLHDNATAYSSSSTEYTTTLNTTPSPDEPQPPPVNSSRACDTTNSTSPPSCMTSDCEPLLKGTVEHSTNTHTCCCPPQANNTNKEQHSSDNNRNTTTLPHYRVSGIKALVIPSNETASTHNQLHFIFAITLANPLTNSSILPLSTATGTELMSDTSNNKNTENESTTTLPHSLQSATSDDVSKSHRDSSEDKSSQSQPWPLSQSTHNRHSPSLGSRHDPVLVTARMPHQHHPIDTYPQSRREDKESSWEPAHNGDAHREEADHSDERTARRLWRDKNRGWHRDTNNPQHHLRTAVEHTPHVRKGHKDVYGGYSPLSGPFPDTQYPPERSIEQPYDSRHDSRDTEDYSQEERRPLSSRRASALYDDDEQPDTVQNSPQQWSHTSREQSPEENPKALIDGMPSFEKWMSGIPGMGQMPFTKRSRGAPHGFGLPSQSAR